MSNIVIVDGNNLVYASNCAMRLHTSDDFPTQAIKGFFNSLRSYAKKFQPDKIFVVWDGGKSKARMELCPDYKANRDVEKTPQDQMVYEEFLMQIPLIKKAILDLGIYSCSGTGVEGDDLAGMLARMAEKLGKKAIICSSDKDFFQLVNDVISVYNIINRGKKERLTTLENMEELHGLPPEQWLEFKAMLGDKSDNILGVNGIGEVTGINIMKRFGSIDGLALDQASETPTKIGKREQRLLENANRELVERNIKMMDLHNPTGNFSTVKVVCQEPNFPSLREFFKEYELKSFYLEFNSWVSDFNSIRTVET